ncbi:MAG: UDP-glycosyltransferase [Pseudomonadota bacterium]
MKTVLFVTYGSGHVRMVVPVALALADSGLARPVVLALTTAAPVVRAAGLELLQFKDFLTVEDAPALAYGRRLLADLKGPVADPEESVAYLGLCYSELVQDVGEAEAARLYQREGRQAFLPLRTLERIVRKIAPALLVATNSPRAERAAVSAARTLGLPSVCMVDLFCLDEVKWIGDARYADRVCVLNDSVRQFLVEAGRGEGQVVVTGNPAFDTLGDPAHVAEGLRLRLDRKWDGKYVLMWPTQVEPAYHPFNGKPGDVNLPGRALASVIKWVLSRDDCVLCIRPRAGEAFPAVPADPRIVFAGQETHLSVLLQAVDLVVTLNSTVSLEGHLAGTALVQVLGSVFDDAMPLKRYGIADEAVPEADIGAALDRRVHQPRRQPEQVHAKATGRVLEVVRAFL